MPYLYLLKYWQYAVIALLIAALSFVSALYKERGHKIDEIQAKHNLELMTAQAEYQAKARQIEQSNYQGVIDAINASEQRQKQIANDYRAVVATNDSLSDTIQANNTRLINASEAARTEYTASISKLFGECTAEITELAAKADGHVNDIRMMQDAWPTN